MKTTSDVETQSSSETMVVCKGFLRVLWILVVCKNCKSGNFHSDNNYYLLFMYTKRYA
jgi:hypothetical protein